MGIRPVNRSKNNTYLPFTLCDELLKVFLGSCMP